MLTQEARALLTRLGRVKPFALYESMVPAAAISPVAQVAVERFLVAGRRELRARVQAYLRWLNGPDGRSASPQEAQRRFTFLRLRFNVVLSQFDMFADVITQRSEHETGVWLAGLDTVASDALEVAVPGFKTPPLMCYLDRGTGAAIRRARTRLPGGGENPVAIIRVPRERMVGSGIASSLIHEVGHQGAALLDLVASMRPVLKGFAATRGTQRVAWTLWERWISEILADFWSIARVGVASTLGLIGVVSLPRVFVFRLTLDDPHPIPWIRVVLSCAIGHALYPHPQWTRIAGLWKAFYPLEGLDRQRRELFALLESTMPEFVTTMVNHRPRALKGRSLAEVLEIADRQPALLSQYWRSWRGSPQRMRTASPSLVFAAIGQAKSNGEITPERESGLLANLLVFWALRSTLPLSAVTRPGLTA
jgi:hypothetical protein